jgi:hypothetical protein
MLKILEHSLTFWIWSASACHFSLNAYLTRASQTLKDHITLSDERNRILALLSRITASTQIFPHRYELKGIKYHSSPIAGGGFGTVHRVVSDPNICVKVMTKVDSNALMVYPRLFTYFTPPLSRMYRTLSRS